MRPVSAGRRRRMTQLVSRCGLAAFMVGCSTGGDSGPGVTSPPAPTLTASTAPVSGSPVPPTSTPPTFAPTPSSATAAPVTASPTSSATAAPEPLFGGVDRTVELLTPEAGGGPRPDLSWSAVPGADHYGLYVYAPSGDIYWAWQGRATSVPVGGLPRLHDDVAGPSVSEGMTWAVVAYDTDLLPVAVSPRRPISP